MIRNVGATAWTAIGVLALGAGPAAAQARAPDSVSALAGDWTGTLPGQAPTRVIVHVRLAASGVTATYDNLDRGIREVPLADFRRDGDTVSFALPAAQIRYEGRLEADGDTLTGGISQGSNLPQPLVLSRASP